MCLSHSLAVMPKELFASSEKGGGISNGNSTGAIS